jgi:hypothetical protein
LASKNTNPLASLARDFSPLTKLFYILGQLFSDLASNYSELTGEFLEKLILTPAVATGGHDTQPFSCMSVSNSNSTGTTKSLKPLFSKLIAYLQPGNKVSHSHDLLQTPQLALRPQQGRILAVVNISVKVVVIGSYFRAPSGGCSVVWWTAKVKILYA